MVLLLSFSLRQLFQDRDLRREDPPPWLADQGWAIPLFPDYMFSG